MITSSLFYRRGLHALLGLLIFMPIASAQTSQFEGVPIVEKVGDRPKVDWTADEGGGVISKGITYQANATGQAIKVWINIPAPGKYNIKVRHRRYGDRGQVQHLINNVPQGAPRSFYKSGTADFELFDLGDKDFTEPGIKTLELRVHAAGAGGGRFISVDYVQTTLQTSFASGWEYEDDFESETVGQSPSHWIESNVADEWKVDSTTGSTKTYRHPASINSPITWLHVFERDVEFTTRVMYKSKLSGSAQVQLLVRYNHDEASIMAGYDFDPVNGPRRWHLMEKLGRDDPLWEQLTPEDLEEPMEMNRWYTFKVVARGSNVALYIDDMQHPKLFAKDASAHLSPGRVGFRAHGVEAYFDDVKLELVKDQGRVQDGVLEYTILPDQDTPRREGGTFVAMNGKIELLERQDRFTSTDNGQTFTGPAGYGTIPRDEHAHESILRLNSGKLLKLQGEYHPSVELPNSQTPLRFRARRSADEGATWDEGGLTWTDYRAGDDGKTKIIQMNDKLSQSPSGRVFFTAQVRLYKPGEPTVDWGKKCEVYYSDNEGTTWTKADGDTAIWDTEHTWTRFGEGKVIATATPNKVLLYSSWISRLQGSDGIAAGSVRYFTSTDNGETWTNDVESPTLKCARSSFGVDRDLSAGGLVYYMVWVYNDAADHPKLMFPRNRLGLARSTDGETWTYLMDVERWISPDESEGNPIVQILDPGIMVTPTHLFITFGLSDMDDPGEDDEDETHNMYKMRVVRVDKSKLSPRTWPTEY